MSKVGEKLYGLRIVEPYRKLVGEYPFNRFEGIVVSSSDINLLVFRTWIDDGEYRHTIKGIIDESCIQVYWTGREIATFIKKQISKIMGVEQEWEIAIDHNIAITIQVHDIDETL